MREIKFRAWAYHLVLEKYVMKSNQDMHNNTIRYITDEKFFNENDRIIMQFTGLKDKNGVEIYEGDIVKMYDWGGGRSLIGIDTIIWDDINSCYQTDNHIVDDQYDFTNKVRFEVIGNIHQTPELLTPKSA